MVAISLYRGNLHKVPDVPRRWLMPDRKISLKNFKTLLRRRSQALSRLQSTDPNPINNNNNSEGVGKNDNETVDKEKAEFENGGDLDKLVEATESLVVEVKRGDVEENDVEIKGNDVDRVDQKVEVKVEEVVVANAGLEIAKKEEDVSDKQKRRQEIEEKLKVLNAKKHSLVQALKQIINAEEELKRRSNMQGVSSQPPAGGAQGEGTHDSGSLSRHCTPRMGSEGHVIGEAEGTDTNGANHNVPLRHLVRMSSTSPSSDTHQKKSTFTTALPLRTNSGVANSPSRFALSGQQGLPPNLPAVSVSGTNYVASSPSPAASGGTSVFRDRRVPSPWN